MKLQFVGPWFRKKFDKTDNFITTILQLFDVKYNVVDKHGDVLIHTERWKPSPKHQNQKTVTYTAESTPPNKKSTISLGFHDNKPEGNHIALRNYERIWIEQNRSFDLYSNMGSVEYSPDNKFALFAATNFAKRRVEFFDALCGFQKVDSIGHIKKNAEGPPRHKFSHNDWYEFMQQYNFMLCFENKSKGWYLTEKIYNAMKGNTIPLYWGAKKSASEIFNPDSFCYISDNGQGVDRVKEIVEGGWKTFDGQPYVLDPKSADDNFEARMSHFVDLIK